MWLILHSLGGEMKVSNRDQPFVKGESVGGQGQVRGLVEKARCEGESLPPSAYQLYEISLRSSLHEPKLIFEPACSAGGGETPTKIDRMP